MRPDDLQEITSEEAVSTSVREAQEAESEKQRPVKYANFLTGQILRSLPFASKYPAWATPNQRRTNSLVRPNFCKSRSKIETADSRFFLSDFSTIEYRERSHRCQIYMERMTDEELTNDGFRWNEWRISMERCQTSASPETDFDALKSFISTRSSAEIWWRCQRADFLAGWKRHRDGF